MHAKKQDEEYKALRKAGAEVEKAKGVPLVGFEDAPVLRYRGRRRSIRSNISRR